MKFCILLILFLFFCANKCSLTTEYYKKLINENIEKANNYIFPQNNTEFRHGAHSDVIHDGGTYDFIIVGAGSSGAVLATRLSEIHHWNILLLEAGGEETDFSKIPAMGLYSEFSEKNWGYTSIPQKKCCLGMKNRQCMAPRGKSLGGSSAINGLLYTRGNRGDFDGWSQMGNPGWSYKEVLPYFIKSENSQIDGDEGYHGKGGLLNVQYSLPPSDLLSTFINGNEELGKRILDSNGYQQMGISRTQFNVKSGKRQSTSVAFLENARQRTNLRIITKALVTKIIIDKKMKIAEGVIFVKGNAKFMAKAKKQVILSAGAYNSPQLLMLSGIGPRKHLEEVGVEVIEDLPVGENLLDHPLLPGIFFRTNYTYRTSIEEAVAQYMKGLGPFARPYSAEALGYLHSGDLPEEVPMLEYIFILPNSSNPLQRKLYNFDDELGKNYLHIYSPTTDIGFYIVLLHEKSRGRVTLKTKNPIDFPDVDFNFFDHPHDIDNMIEAIEFIMKLSKTKAFQKLNATLVDIAICQNHNKYSKAFWECVLRHMAVSGDHASGTTAMGPDRRYSVVDHRLKVHGIANLRVVDAGIFPTTTSGHPNAATIMVAEKIADVIKREYNGSLQ